MIFIQDGLDMISASSSGVNVKGDQKVFALVMGKVINMLRSERGLTQQQLASSVGVGQATISRIERGTLIPDAMLTERIAATFDLTVTELHEHVDDGIQRTRSAAEGAFGTPPDKTEPWWKSPLKVAGVAGLAGLVIFAVAVALSEEEDE